MKVVLNTTKSAARTRTRAGMVVTMPTIGVLLISLVYALLGTGMVDGVVKYHSDVVKRHKTEQVEDSSGDQEGTSADGATDDGQTPDDNGEEAGGGDGPGAIDE